MLDFWMTSTSLKVVVPATGDTVAVIDVPNGGTIDIKLQRRFNKRKVSK